MFEGLIGDEYYSRYGFDRGVRRYPDVTVKVAPAAILTEAQLLRFTRTDLLVGNDDDSVKTNLDTIAELQDFAMAAQMHLDGPDGCLDRCIGKQTLEAVVSSRNATGGYINLPYGPILKVNSVSYYDSTGTQIIVPSTQYILERGNFIRTFFNLNWPDPTLTVEYDAGYVVPPAPLVHAMKLLVGHFNEHRMAVGELGNLQNMPHGVDTLIKPFRKFM